MRWLAGVCSWTLSTSSVKTSRLPKPGQIEYSPKVVEPGSKRVVPIALGLTDWASALATVNSSLLAALVPAKYQPKCSAGVDDTPNTASGSSVTSPGPALRRRWASISSRGLVSGSASLNRFVFSGSKSPTLTGIWYRSSTFWSDGSLGPPVPAVGRPRRLTSMNGWSASLLLIWSVAVLMVNGVVLGALNATFTSSVPPAGTVSGSVIPAGGVTMNIAASVPTTFSPSPGIASGAVPVLRMASVSLGLAEPPRTSLKNICVRPTSMLAPGASGRSRVMRRAPVLFSSYSETYRLPVPGSTVMSSGSTKPVSPLIVVCGSLMILPSARTRRATTSSPPAKRVTSSRPLSAPPKAGPRYSTMPSGESLRPMT